MDNNEIKGIMVFYIDVGSLPPYKAEAIIERLKDNFNKGDMIQRLREQGYETMWVPVRPNSQTRVEMIPLTPGCVPMISVNLDIDSLGQDDEEEE